MQRELKLLHTYYTKKKLIERCVNIVTTARKPITALQYYKESYDEQLLLFLNKKQIAYESF